MRKDNQMTNERMRASGLVDTAELDALLQPADQDPSGLGTPSIIASISAASAVSAAMGDSCPTTACTPSCGT
jgi:hypothetical protein